MLNPEQKSRLKVFPTAAKGSPLVIELDVLGQLETPASKWLKPIDGVEYLRVVDQSTIREEDPSRAADAIKWASQFGVVEVGGGTAFPLQANEHAYELARFHVGVEELGIIEKIATAIDSVDALDEDGFVLFSFGPQNGEKPTLDGLLHPTPGVGRLRWRFVVTTTNQREMPERVLGLATDVLGSPAIPPWSDLSHGAWLNLGQDLQHLVPSGTLLRVFVMLSAPDNAFRVRVGAKVSGYTQSTTQTGSALANVRVRA